VRAERLQDVLGVRQRAPVPAVQAGDSPELMALLRARHDHRRTVGRAGGEPDRGVDPAVVVPVHLDGLPAEGLRATGVRRGLVPECGGTALAEPVHVDDRDEIREPVMGGVVERLPHRPLRHLAVTEQHEHLRRAVLEPR
jgi:hypothetical protein